MLQHSWRLDPGVIHYQHWSFIGVYGWLGVLVRIVLEKSLFGFTSSKNHITDEPKDTPTQNLRDLTRRLYVLSQILQVDIITTHLN